MALDKLLAIAGREGFNLDSAVPMTYLMQECFTYGLMMIRGAARRLVRVQGKGRLFVGRKVKVRCPSLLYCGEGVRIKDRVRIDALSKDGVRLGDRVLIGRNSCLECTGSLSHVGIGIAIGSRSTFGSDCYFGAAGGIRIGDDVLAGQYIRFHSENHIYESKLLLIREQGVTHQGIEIGNNCWIGSGVVFLDGARLGDGCVVAANSVVTKSFPSNCVIGGVPARLIKER